MSRPCSICTHPRRAEVEEAIVSRVSYRRIARHYGVSIAGISRHLHLHADEEVRAALRQRVEAERRRALSPELEEWLREEDQRIDELIAAMDQTFEDAPGRVAEASVDTDSTPPRQTPQNRSQRVSGEDRYEIRDVAFEIIRRRLKEKGLE